MSNEAPAYFTDFQLHVDKLNFDLPVFKKLAKVPKTDEDIQQCARAAAEITRQILQVPANGKFPYWNTTVYPEFEGLSPLQIELKILKEHKRDNFAYVTKYHRLPYLHGLTALKLMLPETDITPSLADQLYLSMGMFSFNRKRLVSNGAMNSGKTSFGVRAALLYTAIDTDNNFIICGCPYEKSAKSTIFGDYTNIYKEVSTANPAPSGKKKPLAGAMPSTVFPHCKVREGKIISLLPITTKGGWVEYRSLKAGGIAQGMKGNSKDKRETIGVIQVDEAPKVQNVGKFEADTANVSRQNFFQLQIFQNPEDETDAGGQMSLPKKWGTWGWSSFNEVRKEDPDIWPAEKSAIVYRLSALKQVNIVIGKVVYDYLTKQSDIDGIVEDYGENSREYWSQILAMYPGGGIANTLLTTSQVSGSKMDIDYYTILQDNFTAIGVDPSETGLGDNAIITMAKSCHCLIRNIDGTSTRKNLILPFTPDEWDNNQIRVPYVNNFKWSEKMDDGTPNLFFNRFKAVGGDINDLTLGADISYPEQIFLTVAELAKATNTPMEHVVFDGSCRAGMGQAAVLMLGQKAREIPLTTKPIGIQLKARNQNTETFCNNVNSECLYAGADVIASKQVRDPYGLLKLAHLQLCRRKIHPVTKQPQKKIDYKNENGQQSPDHADSWCYLIWKMMSLGFRSSSPAGSESKGRSAFSTLESGRGSQIEDEGENLFIDPSDYRQYEHRMEYETPTLN